MQYDKLCKFNLICELCGKSGIKALVTPETTFILRTRLAWVILSKASKTFHMCISINKLTIYLIAREIWGSRGIETWVRKRRMLWLAKRTSRCWWPPSANLFRAPITISRSPSKVKPTAHIPIPVIAKMRHASFLISWLKELNEQSFLREWHRYFLKFILWT